MNDLSLDRLDEQETCFARAFGAGDIAMARALYQPDLVYLSPTTRLYGRPRRIHGLEPALEFIQLTISGVGNVAYRAEERALVAHADAAFVHVRFDFDLDGARLRSRYVVVYRYRDGRIAEQELFYDPSDRLERL